MDLPFTVEQFLQVFERYNTAIWPAQVVAYAAAFAVLAMTVLRSPIAGRATAAVLAALWLLNGLGYHLAFFREVNPAAAGFAAMFIVQAAFFLWQGVFNDCLRPAVRPTARTAAALLAVAYAMVVYPLAGYLLGRAYPAAPVFGVAPCPTTIFTLGMLLLVRPAAPAWLFAIPMAWSAIGASAAFALRVPEDAGLILAGIGAMVFLLLSQPERYRDEAHA